MSTNNPEIVKMQQQLEQELCFLFREKQVAFDWITKYLEYVQCIDDLVDEPKETERVRDVTKLAAILFNHNYWKQFGSNLYLLERVIANTYFNAVAWENSKEEWKRRDARALTHCGIDMLFAVVLIEFGEEKLADFAPKYREFAHLKNPYEAS